MFHVNFEFLLNIICSDASHVGLGVWKSNPNFISLNLIMLIQYFFSNRSNKDVGDKEMQRQCR